MKAHEEHDFASIAQLGALLKEARSVKGEYELSFDLEYSFDSEFRYAATAKLKELGFDEPEIHGSLTFGRLTVQLLATGVEGIERIMRFDAWMTLTKMLDVAAQMRIEQLDNEMAKPKRFKVRQLLKKVDRIPETEEIEEEVKAMYRVQGLEI